MSRKQITGNGSGQFPPGQPPQMPDSREIVTTMLPLSAFDGKHVPQHVTNAIRDGAIVIDVPAGFIKAYNKKLARAKKKALKKRYVRNAGASGGGAAHVKTAAYSSFQSEAPDASGYLLVREVSPQRGRHGFAPLVPLILLFAAIVAHELGVF